MPKTKEIPNLALSGFDDIFASTVEATHNAQDNTDNIMDTHGERIIEISLEELYPPEFHPFHVNDDEAMERLTLNIKQYGVREPGLVRPRTASSLARLRRLPASSSYPPSVLGRASPGSLTPYCLIFAASRSIASSSTTWKG